MGKVIYAEEIAKLEEQLITYFQNNKLQLRGTEAYNGQIEFFKTKIHEIARYQDMQMRDTFKEDYKDIKFETYSDDSRKRTYGSSGRKGQLHLVKLNMSAFEDLLRSSNAETRVQMCLKACNTIIHEFEHYAQMRRIEQYVLDPDAINFAKQKIARSVNENKKIYEQNYVNIDMEIDARLAGYEGTLEVINHLDESLRGDAKRVFDRLCKSEEDPLKKSTAFFTENKSQGNTKDSNETWQEKEAFINQRIDWYIKAHPEILNTYKCLNFEYNSDGTPKSNVALINDMRNRRNSIIGRKDITPERKKLLIKQNREAYFDILESRLDTLTIKECRELTQVYGTEGNGGTASLYEIMKKYYNGKAAMKMANYDRLAQISPKDKEFIEMQKATVRAKYQKIGSRILNLKDPTYIESRRIVKGVDLPNINFKLSKDEIEKLERVSKGFISVYDKLESEDDFKRRSAKEVQNIRLVINTVETDRCIEGFAKSFDKGNNVNFTEAQVKIMMRALKAAEAITVTGGRNYLKEFVETKFVSDILKEMGQDKTVLAMREKSKTITSNEPRHTEADLDKILAEKYLSGNKFRKGSPEEDFKYYGKTVKCPGCAYRIEETDIEMAKLAMWKIGARQEGYIVETDLKRGMAVIQKRDSQLIDSEDLRKMAQSEKVLETIVNGKKYETMRDKIVQEKGK